MTERTPSPTSYAAAEKVNPYQLLVDLHDQAIAHPARPSSTDLLAELALAAAVVTWWCRWQPAMIHAALRAGADLADIAAATAWTPQRYLGSGSAGRRPRPARTSTDIRCSTRTRSGPSATASRRR